MKIHSSELRNARALLIKQLSDSRADLDLVDRFDRWGEDLISALSAIYEPEVIIPKLIEVLVNLHQDRDEELRQRDRQRILEPDWFQKPETIGYVAYTDLFAGNLKGVSERIPYLKELGISYLHLMPLLKPRPGANDGGYAVMDYRQVRSDLGDMAQLRATAAELHEAGVSLTLDLVLNHVAEEHDWAMRARAGEEKYRDYFLIFPDRTAPDAYEASLPEVFPDFAPGNFTWDEAAAGWVWTTFNSFQWDVNWSNPDVFCEYADIIGFLANQGVDCLRLDAIAFIWKRLGTNCQNQPEVHIITQALRAFARILAPALIFKAEAIVGPSQVGAYFGEGQQAGKVSDLAYHNSLMVQIWSALAAKDAKLIEHSMSRFHALPSNTAWGVYLRCHDDIGWAIDDSDAQALGLNGHAHRMFLADFYTGKFFGSAARGVDFQTDDQSGERRTSGSSASLAGIEAALESGSADELDTAVARYLCAYSMVFGFGGIPLLYMGDEIGMLNDESYVADPSKQNDNRWIHRPGMNWELAELSASAPEGSSDLVAVRIREGINRIISARISIPSLHAAVATRVRASQASGVVIFERHHAAGDLVQLYNLASEPRQVASTELAGLQGELIDQLTGNSYQSQLGISLSPYQVLWLMGKN